MKAILVANPKGGSGKTTLAVNIAGYLARQGRRVALLDLDRQQSAALWVATRPAHLPAIQMLEARQDGGQSNDSLVVDSPAGLHGKNLEHALKLASKIVVPIVPSLFDLQASRDFLQVLAAEKAARSSHIGIVGMRMEKRTKAAMALEYFLGTLDLPILAYLRETQLYVNAAFEGKSLFDLPRYLVEKDLEQWAPLQAWLEQ